MSDREINLVLSVSSRVWVRIVKAGKRDEFEEAVALTGEIFIFDIEGFCEDHGIQLSKEERGLVGQGVKCSNKYLKPRLVK